jgi:hypothetical protein
VGPLASRAAQSEEPAQIADDLLVLSVGLDGSAAAAAASGRPAPKHPLVGLAPAVVRRIWHGAHPQGWRVAHPAPPVRARVRLPAAGRLRGRVARPGQPGHVSHHPPLPLLPLMHIFSDRTLFAAYRIGADLFWAPRCADVCKSLGSRGRSAFFVLRRNIIRKWWFVIKAENSRPASWCFIVYYEKKLPKQVLSLVDKNSIDF